jgi:hypothetical protein
MNPLRPQLIIKHNQKKKPKRKRKRKKKKKTQNDTTRNHALRKMQA